MMHECYYCEQLFDTKEKLYEHLDVHARTKVEQEDKTEDISSMKKSIEVISKDASPEKAKRREREAFGKIEKVTKEIVESS
jgi:hypothetical protein